MSEPVVDLPRRRRNTRDTEPTVLTVTSEAGVLRALARTERCLELVSASSDRLVASIGRLAAAVYLGAGLVCVGVLMVAVLLLMEAR